MNWYKRTKLAGIHIPPDVNVNYDDAIAFWNLIVNKKFDEAKEMSSNNPDLLKTVITQNVMDVLQGNRRKPNSEDIGSTLGTSKVTTAPKIDSPSIALPATGNNFLNGSSDELV